MRLAGALCSDTSGLCGTPLDLNSRLSNLTAPDMSVPTQHYPRKMQLERCTFTRQASFGHTAPKKWSRIASGHGMRAMTQHLQGNFGDSPALQ